jgi:UDP-GlcNAc:undecaprenyl-phosphate GlcNAc-1-phosphate transferase
MVLPFPGAVPVTAYAAAFAMAGLSSLSLTVFVRHRARVAGLFDWQEGSGGRGGRFARPRVDVPRAGIPRVGGVAVTIAVLATMCAAAPWLMVRRPGWGAGGSGLAVLLAGGVGMHLVGLADDFRPLAARWKFALQVGVALLVCGAGVRLTTLQLPGFGLVHVGVALSTVLTVAWLVGMTNALNLIDGLDGLASGAALFALAALFIFARANGRPDAALMSIALAGATLGFLRFNFYPATIFLGDSGSLFLGFMLGGVGLLSTQAAASAAPTAMACAVPIVVLGLPLLDTSLAVARRLAQRRPIFSGDRAHIHHRLLDRLLARGHSPRTAVLALYALCAVFALCGMWLVADAAPAAPRSIEAAAGPR